MKKKEEEDRALPSLGVMTRKVVERLPGKGVSTRDGARPVYSIHLDD